MRFTILISIVLLAASCNQTSNQKIYNKNFGKNVLKTNEAKPFPVADDTMITYEIPETDTVISIDSILTSVDYIPLESTENSAIGLIDKILLLDDRFIIVDKELSKAVFIFDSTGKFIGKIDAEGSDAFDRATISNVSIDSDNKLILVFDNKQSTLKKYDISGKLIETESMGLRFRDFIPLENNTLLVYSNNLRNDHLPDIDHYSLMAIKDNKEVVYRDFYMNPIFKEAGMYSKFHLTTSGDKIYYFPRFCDTVFAILPEGKKKAVYRFHDKKLMPIEFLYEDQNRKKFYQKLDQHGYNVFSGDFWENSTHAITLRYTAHKGDQRNLILVNKTNSHVLNLSAIEQGKPIKYFPGFEFPIAIEKDKFIGIVEPNNLIRVQEKKPKHQGEPTFSEEMKKLVRSVKIGDNPILMRYKFKNF